MNGILHNARYAKLRRKVGIWYFNILNNLLRKIASCRTCTQINKILINYINVIFQKIGREFFCWQNCAYCLIYTSWNFKQACFSRCSPIHRNQNTVYRKHFCGRRVKSQLCYEVLSRIYKRSVKFSTIYPRYDSSFIVFRFRRQWCAARGCLKN